MVEKVDFVVAGAQKAGTRALRQFLETHPDIGLSLPAHVEPHYFDLRIKTDGSADYALYHQMFAPENLEKVTGDVTPIYLYQHGCLDLIRAYNPHMKVIVVLRDPVARAHSQWAMEHARGKETRGFVRALLHEAAYFLRHGQHPIYSYFQRGLYGRQIARLFETFPQRQCLIISNADLRRHHAETMRSVFDFLEVSAFVATQPDIVHSRSYDPLPVVLRGLLRLLYARDIRRVERLTGLDCRDWKPF